MKRFILVILDQEAGLIAYQTNDLKVIAEYAEDPDTMLIDTQDRWFSSGEFEEEPLRELPSKGAQQSAPSFDPDDSTEAPSSLSGQEEEADKNEKSSQYRRGE